MDDTSDEWERAAIARLTDPLRPIGEPIGVLRGEDAATAGRALFREEPDDEMSPP